MGTFVRQLDGSPHAGENCGPASVASALRWSTRHAVAPTPSLVRKRMKDPVGGTNPADLHLGFDSFAEAASMAGYVLPPMRYRRASEYARLLDHLRMGRGACIAVSYAAVPVELSGDPRYTGFHSIFAAGIFRRGGREVVKVFDPLCDGRREGIPGPGRVWWPLPVLRKATAGYSGRGLATWNGVMRAEVSPQADVAAIESAAAVEATREQDGDALVDALQPFRSRWAVGRADQILIELYGQPDPAADAGTGLLPLTPDSEGT